MEGKGALFGAAINSFAAIISITSILKGSLIVGLICLPVNLFFVGLSIYIYRDVNKKEKTK